ncbi:hypothetical protein GCM10020000_37280 [Streptomyces olivoverticillatus]
MCEDKAAALHPVGPDERGQQRRHERAQRDADPDDRMQMLGRTEPAALLGLLVEQRVTGVGDDARAHTGHKRQQ